MPWPEGVPPHPWLDDERFGPRNVNAGDCERCGAEPRLVMTCGPGSGEYGWDCAREDDWCDGHQDEAAEALRWLAALPEDAADVAYLWWLATGEVRSLPSTEGASRCAPARLPSSRSRLSP